MINDTDIKHEYNISNGADKTHAAQSIAALAVKSLMYELAVTPKPGLVDRNNNGAHSDMDYFTFLNSACALMPYFSDITLMALEYNGCFDELFYKARMRGIEAESEMLKATNGINTHKGAIFSLGLCCLGAGALIAQCKTVTPDALFKCMAQIAGGVTSDFDDIQQTTSPTHGEEQYIKHGLKGIRGEAAAGFPSVATVSLPMLIDMLNSGLSANDAGAVTLMHLIAVVEDTNIAHRTSAATQRAIMAEQQALIKANPSCGALIRSAYELDELFIRENISPGGCADLLALTWLVYFLCFELNI